MEGLTSLPTSNLPMNKLAQDIQDLRNLGKPVEISPAESLDETDGVEFNSLLKQALDAVNSRQQEAADLMTRVETGESSDLLGAMLASQKASLSFQALVQIRNKAVAAYEEIMRMQV